MMKSEKGIAREARRKVGTGAGTYRANSREVAEYILSNPTMTKRLAPRLCPCELCRAPSVRDLAGVLGVSRRTVRRALSYARAAMREQS